MLCPARRINEKECSGCAEELKFRDWPNHTKKRKTGTCRASPLNSSSATLLGCQRPQNVGHVVTGFRHRWPNKVLSSSLSYWPAITLTICMLARKKRERGKGMWMVSAALEWLRSFASRRDHSHSHEVEVPFSLIFFLIPDYAHAYHSVADEVWSGITRK